MSAFFHDSSLPPWESMSFDEVRAAPNFWDHLIFNESSVLYQAYLLNDLDFFAWATSTTIDVIRAGSGMINLYPIGNDYPLSGFPKYIGHYRFTPDDCYADLVYKLHDIREADKLSLDINSIGGKGNINLTAKGKTIITYVNSARNIELSLDGLDLTDGLELSAIPVNSDLFIILFNSVTKQATTQK